MKKKKMCWGKVGLIVGSLGGYLLLEDIITRRELQKKVEECQRQQRENDRRFKEFIREHEKRMLDQHGENWRDHEPKGAVLRLLSYSN